MTGEAVQSEPTCDSCIENTRPWRSGYAAFLYSGTGRELVLKFKHGDRTDLAKPLAKWMVAKLPHDLSYDLVLPVPLHRRRFLERRYNQAALLSNEVAKLLDCFSSSDYVLRVRPTDRLNEKTVEERRAILSNCFVLNERKASSIEGKKLLLVDDVMTSCATLEALTNLCLSADAAMVDVLVAARVAKSDL